ncbi:MAG: GNAT family N-acetyltransferase [Oscillospiraceae bacterium]|nr:GNAT family N-acetyltransferase [Oscillospiraceae bacterium]
MTMREKWDGLPLDILTGGGLTIREVRDDGDLWFATAECALAPGQEELVNPAGFDIGRAYLNPADNVPCVICLEDGTRIGFIVFRMWLAAGTAYSWGYHLDRNWQGRGYGERAARLAIRILKAMGGDMPIKLSAEVENTRAQRLYERIGFHRLDELDGDDLVFGL